MTCPVGLTSNLRNALDAYQAGQPVKECVSIAGVDRTTFYKRMREAGIPFRAPQPTKRTDPREAEAAIAAYRAGGTLDECAAMCGITGPTFRHRLMRLGVPLRDTRWHAEAIRIPLPDGFAEKFLAGANAAALAREYGMTTNTVYRRLKDAGIDTARRATPVPDALVEDYLGGESVKALGRRHDVDRNTVARMLRDAGIDTRGRSEAMRLRWQRASEIERRAMLDNAHESVRGRTVPDAERVAIAAAKEGQALSPLEIALGAMLADLGLDIAYGTPCGPYNIDIVIAGTVAVEVFGGQWHETGRHRARFGKRARHIFDAGYSLAIVWADEGRYPLGVQCAQHLGTLAQITGSHPAIGRQHWVIRGDGYFLAVREDDGDEVPFITSSGRRDG